MTTIGRHTKRVFIAISGGLITLIGLILIPYPGPGWLVVFAGLAILATEFEFARRWLDTAKDFYDRSLAWLKRQPIIFQLMATLLTGLVVVVSVYLLNGFGITNAIFHLHQDWLVSPLFK